MLKGGDSGPLFEPGKPDESLLVKMIAGTPPEMPQKQPPLSAEKVELLRRWVAAGAKDDSTPGEAAAIKIPASYKFPVALTSVALSPDGKLAAAACRSEVEFKIALPRPALSAKPASTRSPTGNGSRRFPIFPSRSTGFQGYSDRSR